MEGWHDFFVTMSGAAVAFAGLVLVGISINLDRIIEQPGLVDKSAGPLIVLFTLFVTSSVMLIPGQRIRFLGFELLVASISFAIAIGIILRRQSEYSRQVERQGIAPPNSFRFRLALCAVIVGFLILGSGMLIGGNTTGIYALVPAIVIGFLYSFLEAWVLLIEIDR